MLEPFFKAIVLTSCMGTALTALLMIVKPLTRKIFSPSWQYYIWLAVLFVMIIPVKFDISLQTASDIPKHIKTFVNVGRSTILPAVETQVFQIGLEEIWFVGAILMLIWKFASYTIFLHGVQKNGEEILCSSISRYTSKKIKVIKSNRITSPLLTGVFRHILILPRKDLTEQQLSFILAHEMTHLKRNDILYKWLICLVKCVHWFNPVIYFVSRHIDTECEISCDIAVTEWMNKQEKISYVNTLLSLAVSTKKNIPVTTGMANGKQILKRRILSVVKIRKNSRFVKIISMFVILACITGMMFVSGTASGLMLNHIENRLLLSVKLPVFKFRVEYGDDVQKTAGQNEEHLNFTKETVLPPVESELPKGEGITPEERTDLSNNNDKLTNARVIKYSSDDKSTHYVILQPDESGLISIFFDSENQSMPVSVSIYDSERPGQGWGYHLPSTGQQVYEFDGFAPEKTYTIEINTYCPGNYGIEGKAYIY